MEGAGLLFSQMFTGFTATLQSDALLRSLLTPLNLVTVAAGILFSLPWLPWLKQKLSGRKSAPLWDKLSYGAAAVLYCLCVMNLASSDFNPFIYFRF